MEACIARARKISKKEMQCSKAIGKNITGDKNSKEIFKNGRSKNSNEDLEMNFENLNLLQS